MPHTYALSVTPGDPTVGLPGTAALATAYGAFVAKPTTGGGFATAGVPGFAAVEPWTFDVHRRISAHPTVALVMRVVTALTVADTRTGRGLRGAMPLPIRPAFPRRRASRLAGRRGERCPAR